MNEILRRMLEVLSLEDVKTLLEELCKLIVDETPIGYIKIRILPVNLEAEAGMAEGEIIEEKGELVTVWGDSEDVRELHPAIERFFERVLYYQEVRTFFEKTPDVILVLDERGVIVDQNNSAALVFGDIRGKKFQEICSENVCSIGDRVYSLVNIKGLRRNVVLGRDITDRIRLEKELEDRERKFRALAELSPAGILVHHQGKILFVNSSLCRILGYDMEEITQKTVWELIHPDFLELAKKMMQRRLRGERPVYELKIVRKDGSEGWVLVAGGAIDWEGIKAVMAFAVDVTDKKLIEQRLDERERLFESIFDNSPVGQFIVSKGVFRMVNPTFTQITGYSADELIGRRSLEIVHEDDRSIVRENAIKMLKGEVVEPYKYRIVRKDGEIRWVYENVTSITYEGERAVLGNVVDITELETERKRLEELTSMLELINKTLRHDVMNALTSSTAFLEMAIEEDEMNLAEKALTSTQRAVSIVKNMRAFEDAIKTGELKCVDARKIAEEVASSFENVHISGFGKALADEGLRSVIENIVNNAFIHSGTDRVEIEISENESFCEIRVKDYGVGVPDEIKHKIFEEGFKYGKTAQTGLGLFIARKIVNRYGGEIWVEDNEPKGSVFVIRLRRC